MKKLLALATAAALLLGAAGCAKHKASAASPENNDLKGVVLKVGDQKAGSKPLLAAAGLLDGTGYTIQWSNFTSGPPLLEAANAGAIDLGSVGDAPPIFAASGGSKITIVAATHSAPNGSAILIPKDSPITALAQLKGKKVAVAKGSSSNAHLLNALASVGLTFNDITPAYLQPADALAAFSRGSVDAWAIWDPYTALAQQNTGAKILVDGSNGLLSGLSFTVAATPSLSDPKKVRAIRDYLGRLARAREWTRSHHDVWAATWSKEAGIPPAVAKLAVERADQHAVTIDDALVAAEQHTADVFLAAQLIPNKVDINAITDRQFNDTVPASS
jgi:sulfonate transport system substrate-binding protein